MRLISSMIIAFATYSRIPMPRVDWNDENRRYALCFFPLIGAVIGIIMWLWFKLCGALGLNGFLKGAVGTLLPIWISGGIHLDGFMDTSDALASWQEPARRLEILKDSHTGAFAVIKCAAYLLLNAAIIGELSDKALTAACAVYTLSRALSAYLSISIKQARPGGMLDGFASTAAGRAVKISSTCFALISIAFIALFKPISAALCVIVCAALAVYYRHMALKYFGGVTGDLAGWLLCMCEICALLAIFAGGLIL